MSTIIRSFEEMLTTLHNSPHTMSLLHTIGEAFWPAVFTIAMVAVVAWIFKLIFEDVNG